MRTLISLFQRLTATTLVASFYLLPAAMGSIVQRADLDLEAAPVPERVVAYVMDLTPIAGTHSEEEQAGDEADRSERSKTRPERGGDDVLAVPGGASTGAPALAASHPGKQRSRKGREKKARRGGQQCQDSSGQISQVSERKYRVQRSLVDHYAGDMNAAEQLASAAWHRDASGEIDGIRVKRIRCGSPLHEAGLRNGDIIHQVNGRSVDSLAGAIALWWQLRRQDSLRVVLSRAGDRLRMRYLLV